MEECEALPLSDGHLHGRLRVEVGKRHLRTRTGNGARVGMAQPSEPKGRGGGARWMHECAHARNTYSIERGGFVRVGDEDGSVRKPLADLLSACLGAALRLVLLQIAPIHRVHHRVVQIGERLVARLS